MRWFRLAILLTTAVQLSSLNAAPQAVTSLNVASSQPGAASSQLLHYTLPPDKLAKAHALYNIDFTLFFVTSLWAFVVLFVMLQMRFGVVLREWAERASQRRFLQAAMVTCAFAFVMTVVQLPFDVYGHHIGLAYGLSVQHWGSWFADWGKSLGLEFVFVTFVGWIFYGVLRRSRRRWWFYFWLALIPIVVFIMFVAPVVVEPMFNQYEPLAAHHPELVAQIERVIERAGMNIPPERMYEMKASEKTTELNAYVSGFGATKRVVVWDNTMRQMTIPETLYVFGHEMGHYVLGHIPQEIAINLLLLLVLFYIGYWLANRLVGRYGEKWDIRDLSDWA